MGCSLNVSCAPGESFLDAAAEGVRCLIRAPGDAALAMQDRAKTTTYELSAMSQGQSGVASRPDKAPAFRCRRTPKGLALIGDLGNTPLRHGPTHTVGVENAAVAVILKFSPQPLVYQVVPLSKTNQRPCSSLQSGIAVDGKHLFYISSMTALMCVGAPQLPSELPAN